MARLKRATYSTKDPHYETGRQASRKKHHEKMGVPYFPQKSKRGKKPPGKLARAVQARKEAHKVVSTGRWGGRRFNKSTDPVKRGRSA